MNHTLPQNIFASRKAEVITGVIIVIFLAAFSLFSFRGSLFSQPDTTEAQLRAISAQQVAARIEKSNFLSQQLTAQTLLSEAEAGLNQANQKILDLRAQEVKLGEERAQSISTVSLGQ